MGANESKEIPKGSPLRCVLAHWKELVNHSDTETKRELIKLCTQWWPLYRLEEGVKWPSSGTLDYNTLVQLMLFLRHEQKWHEVAYADMFFTVRNHPEWQRACGIRPPSDPLVLALEKDNKANKGKPKRCCSTCSINQRCTHPDKVYCMETQEEETEELLKRQGRRRVVGEVDSELPSTSGFTPTSSSLERTVINMGVPPLTPEPQEPTRLYPPLPSSESEEELSPQGPIASRTRRRMREAIQAPLRETATSEGQTVLV